MVMRMFTAVWLLLVSVLLAACGGGSGGGGGGASASGYTISGQTLEKSVALPGVTVTLKGDRTDSVVSDASGSYSFSGLPIGNYGVTPTKTGYAFNPSSTGFTQLNRSYTGINWTGNKIYNLSGSVLSGGVGVAGVNISVSGAYNSSTTTDSAGNYTLTGLPSGGPFIVKPSQTGNTFTPSSITQTISTQDVTGVDFTATNTGTTPIGTLKIINASSSLIDQAYTRLSSSSSWGVPWNGSSLSSGSSWSLSLTPGTYDNQVASIGTVSTYYAYDLAYSITSGSTHTFTVGDQDFTGTLLINNLNTSYPITEVYVSSTTYGSGVNLLSTSIATSSSRQIVGFPSGTYYVRIVQNGVNIDGMATLVSHSYTTIDIN